MRNRTYGGVRGRKTKVGRKLLRFPPTRFCDRFWTAFWDLSHLLFFVATISDKNQRKVWNEPEEHRNFAPEIKKTVYQFRNLSNYEFN